jgi:hypothetical protein
MFFERAAVVEIKERENDYEKQILDMVLDGFIYIIGCLFKYYIYFFIFRNKM